jgi:glycosyltransferase involved in cell wall biosynthesis
MTALESANSSVCDLPGKTQTQAGGMSVPARTPVLVFATQGSGHGDEQRVLDLVNRIDHERFAFDRGHKARSGWRLLRTIRSRKPKIVVMEGTGIAGGVAVILGRYLAGVPYVVSSGDAVEPFLSAKLPLLKPLFALYERMLCRTSAGFIGWTPYLVGRALSFGAPHGMTAPGWSSIEQEPAARLSARRRVRAELNIGEDELVFGIAGTLDWNKRIGYCYGYELVRAIAIAAARRKNVRVLIVGDGSGRKQLESMAGANLGRSVLLTGRVPRERVADYLAAMDIGSLPQSVDGVGSFRYTIKLSEYLSASLPVVTGQIPLAYDLDEGWLWRLAGRAPWDKTYVDALAALMGSVTPEQIAERQAAAGRASARFSKEPQIARATTFLNELIACAPSPE